MARLQQPLSALILAASLALAGCAGPARAPDRDALLRDALFDHPPRPVGADDIFRVDDAMRAYLARALAGTAWRQARPRALADALYAHGELRLDYDGSRTRNAAEAFADRAGNCLSLVIMTAAFARELGLEVGFQRVRAEATYSREGGLTLRSGHVNLVLGPRPPRSDWRSLGVVPEPDRLQIDFQPPEDLRGLRSEPIAEATVRAMYGNNRAAEALQQGDVVQAYAWAREALRHDARFWPAYNTLGVVYQRAGQAEAAEAAYRHLLAADGRQVAAMWNLAQLLAAQGRHAEAAAWDARRTALEPLAPYQQLRDGQAALARGDAAAARALFEGELALTGPSHELQFGLALAHHRLGEPAAAQRALQQAIALSPGADQRARYAGKLAWLRAQAGGPSPPPQP